MKKSNYLFSIVLFAIVISFLTSNAQFTNYTTSSGLANNNVLAAMADNSGNVWFGTNGGGVSKFNGTTWQTYTTSSGLGSNVVKSIVQDNSGNIWFATSYGVTRFTGSTWTNYTTSNGVGSNLTKSLAVGSNGYVWVGTEMGGVSRFNGSSWTTYKTSNTSGGLAHDFVNAITCDLQGNMWFATSNGVSKYNGSTWTNLTSYLGTNSQVVQSAACDSAGAVWFGSHPGFGIGGGVNMYNGTWHFYKTTNGLVHNDVQAIASDGNNMWFGAYQLGVSKFNNNVFVTYDIYDGLVNNNVQAITVDNQGRIWFGTAGGVSKLTSLSIQSVVPKGLTCNQTNNGSITINAAGLNPVYYSVDSGATFQAGKVVSGLTQGNYFVAVTDSIGIIYDTAYTLGVVAFDVLNLGSDQAICDGDSFHLIAPAYASSYTWSPVNLISDTTIYNPWGFPDSTTTFRVEVIDTNQCYQYDSIIISINPVPPVPIITVNDSLFSAPSGYTYQWYLYENPIIGATSQTFIATDPGIYYGAIFNTVGCPTKSAMIHYKNTSINTIQNTENNINIFPNPSNGLISVEIQNPAFDKIIIELLNINGQVVIKKSYDVKLNQDFHQSFDLRELEQGVYMLRTYNDLFINTERIVIYK